MLLAATLLMSMNMTPAAVMTEEGGTEGIVETGNRVAESAPEPWRKLRNHL